MKKIAANPFILLFLFGIAHAQLNLASNGTPSQSSNYHFQGYPVSAILAVFGGPTHDWFSLSCSTTAESKTIRVAWWMLTFPSELVFTSYIVIYYRSLTPERLAGFSLYITNTSISTTATSPPSDGLCYHHDGNELPNILQNITCNQMGQHVIIYNERKTGEKYPANYSTIVMLELCDVQIFGCYKSWWGGDCGKRCPSYCIDNHCYPDNGTCVWGCNSNNCLHGYCINDEICTDGCIKGHAGLKCFKRNAANETFIVSAGGSETKLTQITDGDKAGSCITLRGPDTWILIATEKLIVVGTINVIFKGDIGHNDYKLSISNTSGIKADVLHLTNQNIVKHVTPFPVIEHYQKSVFVGRYVLLQSLVSSLEICEVEVIGCPSGLYGDQCDISCPSNCDGACHPENGHCVLGCKNRYFGSQCEKSCTPPQFGGLCNATCHCINQPCDFLTGVCPSGGCQEGWIGQSCSREILCRTDTLPKQITYLPSLPVYRYRQNVTFYCASGFFGTSVDSTCISENTWIPSPPICASEAQVGGVSVSLFVSVIVSVIVIAVSVICGMWILFRRQLGAMSQKQTRYEDLHVHQAPKIGAEIKETTYEELGGNC